MPDVLTLGQGGSASTASGSTAQRILSHGMDPGIFRPYFDSNGGQFYTLNAGTAQQQIVPTHNALLQRDEWNLLDSEIMNVARPKMRLWSDMRAISTRTIPNGMNYSVLQHQRRNGFGRANLSMDGITRGRQERMNLDLEGLPLPIVSKEFELTAREIAISRQMGTDIDTTGAADAAASCAEEVERIVSGTAGNTFSYGGHSIYGYQTFPGRLTGTLTDPAGGTWTPDQTRNDVIMMLQSLANQNHTGPFKMYYSRGWLQYMLRRYSDYEARPLSALIAELPGIASVEQADYLTGLRFILVESDARTVQAVVGMELQTIQWEEAGGQEIKFKVMGILVPRFRADQEGQTGISDYVV